MVPYNSETCSCEVIYNTPPIAARRRPGHGEYVAQSGLRGHWLPSFLCSAPHVCCAFHPIPGDGIPRGNLPNCFCGKLAFPPIPSTQPASQPTHTSIFSLHDSCICTDHQPLHEWILACCWRAGWLETNQQNRKPRNPDQRSFCPHLSLCTLCQLKVKKTETRFRIPIFPKFFRVSLCFFLFLFFSVSGFWIVGVCS